MISPLVVRLPSYILFKIFGSSEVFCEQSYALVGTSMIPEVYKEGLTPYHSVGEVSSAGMRDRTLSVVALALSSSLPRET